MRTALIYNFLIEATIIAGIAVLLMIPVRKFFRKQLGTRALCFAWLLVAVRLLCPLSLPNPLINEIVTPYNMEPEVIRPIAAQVKIRMQDALSDLSYQNLKSHMDKESISFNEAIQKKDYKTLLFMASDLEYGYGARRVMMVYVAGAAAVTGWFIVTNVRFRRKLKKNRIAPLEGELLAYYQSQCEQYKVKPLPVYFVDPLSSACLVGAVRPYIALPLAANTDQAKQMLAHELCHYKAKDHYWTLLTLICCVVHWFNPLVWAAAAMSRMDRELRCDDSVTRGMDEEGRKLYAGTLIQSVTRRAIPGLPVLATGMSMTGRKLKTRVGSILWGGRRKKAFALTFAALASLLLVFAFGTAAYGEQPDIWNNSVDTAPGATYEIQTMEQALTSDDAVRTEEEALQIAKDILSGPEFKMDIDDSIQWKVGYENGAWGKMCYVVTGKKGNGPEIRVSIAVNGSGAWCVTNGFDPYYAEDYMATYEPFQTISDVLTEEEQYEIKNYCYNLTEQLEPGESNNFNGMYINCYINADGKIYVQVEAPYSEDTGKTFVLLVKPELRVIDYYTGNG